MEKIKMTTPLVEMDGDEMAAILWKETREKLVLPFVDLMVDYYDLSIRNRDRTDDQVTVDSANAANKYGVSVKCATITPNLERMQEYQLKKMWKSPNATIRSIMDGTVFRAPILIKGIEPYIKTWTKPITLARHAYGDLYRASEMKIDQPGKCELVFTAEDGTETRELIHNFTSPGIAQGIHNLDASIRSFARCCMTYALDVKQDLIFSAKDTISKVYDRNFREIFKDVFMSEFMEAFEKAGITYQYCLIDDAISRAVKNQGGYVWACQNYDGDVMSDMLATAYGSAAMMTSVLVSPNGKYEYEAAHESACNHYGLGQCSGKTRRTGPKQRAGKLWPPVKSNCNRDRRRRYYDRRLKKCHNDQKSTDCNRTCVHCNRSGTAYGTVQITKYRITIKQEANQRNN